MSSKISLEMDECDLREAISQWLVNKGHIPDSWFSKGKAVGLGRQIFVQLTITTTVTDDGQSRHLIEVSKP